MNHTIRSIQSGKSNGKLFIDCPHSIYFHSYCTPIFSPASLIAMHYRWFGIRYAGRNPLLSYWTHDFKYYFLYYYPHPSCHTGKMQKTGRKTSRKQTALEYYTNHSLKNAPFHAFSSDIVLYLSKNRELFFLSEDYVLIRLACYCSLYNVRQFHYRNICCLFTSTYIHHPRTNFPIKKKRSDYQMEYFLLPANRVTLF